jgi:hypothetical protein
MDFYSGELFVKIYLLYARLLYQLTQLLENIQTGSGVKICEKDFGCVHIELVY